MSFTLLRRLKRLTRTRNIFSVRIKGAGKFDVFWGVKDKLRKISLEIAEAMNIVNLDKANVRIGGYPFHEQLN